MHDPQLQSLTTFPSFLILLISTQLRSRWRRRLRNLHTDPSLPLSFSSVGTVFTILHASLSPYRPSPGLHCRCKICKSRRKGAELYGADRSSAASLPPGGHSIAFWRSKLEFILVLRRFRAPSFPPPSSPFGRFLVSPFASVGLVVPVSPFCVLCSQPCSKYGWDLPPRLPALPLPLPLLVICKVDGSIL